MFQLAPRGLYLAITGYLTLLCLVCAPSAVAQDPPSANRAAPEVATRDGGQAKVRADGFMVVAAHPLAARAARHILRSGGAAIDAVIAAQMVLNLVEPQSSGIGGGGFLLHWDAAEKKLTSYDGRERAPQAATPRLFLNDDATPMRWPDAVGMPISVGVPGLVAMLDMAQAAHGTARWAELFAPAISLARNGFGVSPRLSALLADRGADAFGPGARAMYFSDDAEAWPLGHVLKNPQLADTFTQIATTRSAAFYTGPIAQAIVDALNAAPGKKNLMTVADLSRYRAIEREPICMPYRALAVCGMGPPSSGGLTVAQILGMLDRFDLSDGPTAQVIHLVLEAQKLSYADRNRYIADPDHSAVPSGLTDPAYLVERAMLIDPAKAMQRAKAGTPRGSIAVPGADHSREAPGTTHISVVDAQGNAASLTSSIETAFGSRIMAGGFLLNNQLTDFSFRHVDAAGRVIANAPGPGKRPRSSMSPTIVLGQNGALRAVLGSPGGSRIILYVAKAVVAMTDWGMGASQAAALPNFGSRNGPAEIEKGVASDLLAAQLEALGHGVVRPSMTSGLHIIDVQPSGILTGGADPRREGTALGGNAASARR